MKEIRKISLTLFSLLLLLSSFLTSCANPVEKGEEKVTITYANGENVTSKEVDKKTVTKGYRLTLEDLPPITVSENYEVMGW